MKPRITAYEYNRVADRKRLDFIVKILKNEIPANGYILDVGCGNGIISRHLGLLGYKVLGIDVSEKAIAVATSKNVLDNVRFEAISAEALAAKDMQYDAVICSEVLEHLHDPSVLLKTIFKSLKENGTMIVTVPNGMGPRELFVTKPMLKARNNPQMWKSITKVKGILGFNGTTVQSEAENLDHVQFFTCKALHELAEKSNFKITCIAKTNFVEDVFPFSLVTKRLRILQSFDCMVADILPTSFTGGFNTVWKKNKVSA